MSIQIDVVKILHESVVCKMFINNDICVGMMMSKRDYELLKENGFFIRDGKIEDSAGCWNTTSVYKKKGVKNED